MRKFWLREWYRSVLGTPASRKFAQRRNQRRPHLEELEPRTLLSFTPVAGSPFGVGTSPFSVAVADVNGDGKPDLVTANRHSGIVSVLLGTGTGSFGSQTTFAVGSEPISAAIADVNGDGKRDLVATNFGTSGSVS